MPAQILSISSMSRPAIHEWERESEFKGFTKALKALSAIKPCSVRESITALENWVASGLMSEAEVSAVFAFHGWERGS